MTADRILSHAGAIQLINGHVFLGGKTFEGHGKLSGANPAPLSASGREHATFSCTGGVPSSTPRGNRRNDPGGTSSSNVEPFIA